MRLKFWKTSSGRSPVEDFISKLKDASAQQVIYDMLEFIESNEEKYLMASGTFDPVAGYKPLLETRMRRGKRRYRLLSITTEAICWALHIFPKKTPKIPSWELETAMKRAKTIIN